MSRTPAKGMSLTAAVLMGLGGMIGTGASHLTVLLLGTGLPVVMTRVNFVGSKSVSKAESVIVGLKVTILLVFTLLDAMFASIVGNVPGAKPLLTSPVR